ncbi:DUF3667 domain-containing protein [Flavobacteriaceae bacterium XHP0103]|uniref:DUF3667 domain-containing protein n=1 Tax=Marixanthotalea marina TaxID=2844359 RepID=UPI002989F8D0|nr:DUF3667 domain-containing protein [Marixanthotalea marina]MBU3822321.1 DUF3667 domain-containing protein [Marixanthotalea marina]
MPRKVTTCKNCERRFFADFNYCPYCGQNHKEELTLGVLFSNTISNYFSVDARFFKSFWPLMAKPGYLAKRFLEGKRLLYLHPAQMYLFISVVFFFFLSFIAREQERKIDQEIQKKYKQIAIVKDSIKNQKLDTINASNMMSASLDYNKDLGVNISEQKTLDSLVNLRAKNPNETSGWSLFDDDIKVDSLLLAGQSDEAILREMGVKDTDSYLRKRLYVQVLKFHKSRSGSSFVEAFYDSLPIAMFILLPFFALILKLLYFKKGSYAHHLVFSFYFFSYLFVVFALLVLASLIWPGFPGWLLTLIIFSVFFYLMIALKKFYNQSWFVSCVKTCLSTIVFGAFTFTTTILLIVFAILYF